MNLTILPAGTTGNRDADAAKIAEIVALAEKYAPGCRWAVQVQIPESMEHEPDDKTPVNDTPRGKVISAMRLGRRLPRIDQVYLDEETELDAWDRAARLRAVTIQVWAETRRMPSGAYAVPRVSHQGEIDSPDALGEMHMLYAAGMTSICTSAYCREIESGGEQQIVYPPMLDLRTLCRYMGRECRPFISGQVRGDGELVPEHVLGEQRDDLRRHGVDSAIVWCNIGNFRAVQGMERILKVYAEVP